MQPATTVMIESSSSGPAMKYSVGALQLPGTRLRFPDESSTSIDRT
jgi:hypothetical protein